MKPTKQPLTAACTETIKPPHKLTPEQQDALDFFTTNLPRIKTHEIAEKHTHEEIQVFKQSKIKLSSIPSGSFWHWNQTKQKQIVDIEQHNVTVQFRKLIPRKKCIQDPTPLPELRLWHFTFTDPQDDIPIHVLWYQRGYNEHEPQALELENYSFLAAFMTPSDAQQFWPSTDQNNQ